LLNTEKNTGKTSSSFNFNNYKIKSPEPSEGKSNYQIEKAKSQSQNKKDTIKSNQAQQAYNNKSSQNIKSLIEEKCKLLGKGNFQFVNHPR
jgi:hypothetical protein